MTKIGIVAPASRLDPKIAARVSEFAAKHAGLELRFHPQCFLSHGHFAGDDAARADAFVDYANAPDLDAIWFARGGYGSGRIAARVLPKLALEARKKKFLGYSDNGTLLAALYANGFKGAAHGPMPSDIAREDGEVAISRALDFLTDGASSGLEPAVQSGVRTAAFNITILSHLIGTPFLPNLAGHVVMLEEVAEAMYRIDRAMLHITSNPDMRRVAGIMLGRCSAIPENDPAFEQSEEDVVKHWCHVSHIPYLGRADIGHDSHNKIVPFGRPLFS